MKLDTWKTVSHSHLWFMRLFALIPLEGKSLDSFFTRLLAVYSHVINIYYHSTYTTYTLTQFTKRIFEVDYICETMVVQGVFFRYLILYGNRKNLIKLVEMCRDLWSHLVDNEAEIVQSFERRARQFRTFVLINTMIICTTYFVTFFMLSASMPKNEWPTVFKFYVEVNADSEPWFTIIMISQVVMSYTVSLEMTAVEGIGLYLIMMACGYLRVIKNRLLIIGESEETKEDEETTYRKVVNCAKFHQDIMLYCTAIESLMSKVFIITVFTTIYNVSFICIKLLENSDDKYIYITIMTGNLVMFFTVQWAPEHLLTEIAQATINPSLIHTFEYLKSEAIGESAYFASLRQLPQHPKKTNKALLLMMLRAQRPIQLTAAGIINLSIETFGAMLKNAFSFFAVLRSFQE